MATIVTHKEKGGRFVVLGGGYGMFRSERPGFWFGDWSPDVKEGSAAVLVVCDFRRSCRFRG